MGTETYSMLGLKHPLMYVLLLHVTNSCTVDGSIYYRLACACYNKQRKKTKKNVIQKKKKEEVFDFFLLLFGLFATVL